MNSQRILHRLAPWALPILLLAVWQLSVSAGWLSTRILPAPQRGDCSRGAPGQQR